MTARTYAYLGPQGTFSDQAVREFVDAGRLDPDYEGLACTSLPEVFEALDRGRADYGVVPIENSLEGPVTTVLDSFAFNSRAEILGELVLDIHQSLLLAPGAGLRDVKTIVSHPQGIGQCRRWIERHLPDAELRLADSTAAAAHMAVADASIAGIASSFSASLVGAQVYEEGIEDNINNRTRFVLIGPAGTRAPRTGAGKSTLALFIQSDRSGVLHMILSEFAFAGVNLTMVQSRPTKRDLGEYMFFMDIDGYAEEPAIATALNCLRMKLREVKVIGSYPRAE